MTTPRATTLTSRPLTRERWEDLLTVFGPRGAYSGCWCMYWRITRKEFEAKGNKGNREAFHKIVDAGTVPGLLYYQDGRPMGWCALGPRDHFPSLNRSPLLKAIDQRPVWSLVCLFVLREYRGKGLSSELILQAVDYARSQGAEAVEAYPDLHAETTADSFMGIEDVYLRLGFQEAARRKPHRPILRYDINRTAPRP